MTVVFTSMTSVIQGRPPNLAVVMQHGLAQLRMVYLPKRHAGCRLLGTCRAAA